MSHAADTVRTTMMFSSGAGCKGFTPRKAGMRRAFPRGACRSFHADRRRDHRANTKLVAKPNGAWRLPLCWRDDAMNRFTVAASRCSLVAVITVLLFP